MNLDVVEHTWLEILDETHTLIEDVYQKRNPHIQSVDLLRTKELYRMKIVFLYFLSFFK